LWRAQSVWSDAIGLAVVITGGVALYAALAWMLRVEAREEIAELVRRRIQKTST